LSESGRKHCVVIGAGIVGSSCAWHLVKQGHEVTVIDPVLPGQSTSFGNAGCISPSAVIPFSYPGAIRQVPKWLIDSHGPLVIRLSHLPQAMPWLYRFWRAGSMPQVEAIVQAQKDLMATVRSDYDTILAETRSDWMSEKRGLIMIHDNEKSYRGDAWQYEMRQRLGQELSRLTSDELFEMEPALAEHPRARDRVAVYDPAWSHLTDPGEVTRNIAEAAFSQGANWIQDRVLSLSQRQDGAEMVTGNGQKLTADSVVVAAGVWSGKLLSQLGVSVPVTAKRGYHTMVHNPSIDLNHPIMSVSQFFVITPMRLGIRLAGTAEFAAIDSPPDYQRARILLDHSRKYFVGLEGESYSEWMGQRPMMPDSKPVLGALPNNPNIFCAFGHGHYGLTQGPTSGRIIADLIAGREPHLDLSPFAADRF